MARLGNIAGRTPVCLYCLRMTQAYTIRIDFVQNSAGGNSNYMRGIPASASGSGTPEIWLSCSSSVDMDNGKPMSTMRTSRGEPTEKGY